MTSVSAGKNYSDNNPISSKRVPEARIEPRPPDQESSDLPFDLLRPPPFSHTHCVPAPTTSENRASRIQKVNKIFAQKSPDLYQPPSTLSRTLLLNHQKIDYYYMNVLNVLT